MVLYALRKTVCELYDSGSRPLLEQSYDLSGDPDILLVVNRWAALRCDRSYDATVISTVRIPIASRTNMPPSRMPSAISKLAVPAARSLLTRHVPQRCQDKSQQETEAASCQ